LHGLVKSFSRDSYLARLRAAPVYSESAYIMSSIPSMGFNCYLFPLSFIGNIQLQDHGLLERLESVYSMTLTGSVKKIPMAIPFLGRN
jgi:hypothetical protein